jgi:hypothetical protein
MTTVGLRIPMQRALRGGMMIGAEVISVAELMQYALIIVSSAWQEFEARPLRTRNVVPGPIESSLLPWAIGSSFAP